MCGEGMEAGKGFGLRNLLEEKSEPSGRPLLWGWKQGQDPEFTS